MTDRYENIRLALEMGPTPGPWKWWEYEDLGYCCVNPLDGGLLIAKCDVRDPFDPEQRANAALIGACDPDTIRALLAERDALAALAQQPPSAPVAPDFGYAGCTLWRGSLRITVVESKSIERHVDPDQAFCDMVQRALDSLAAAWDARTSDAQQQGGRDHG